MRRIFGMSSLLVLGVSVFFFVRSLVATPEPAPLAFVQDDAQVNLVEVQADPAEGPEGAARIPGPSVLGQRSVRLDWVEEHAGVVTFMVEAKLYQRDPPARFFWVARIRETPKGEPLREWAFLDHEFDIVPGVFNTPFFLGWIPHDLDHGTYVLELTIDSLGDPFDLTSNWSARRPFEVH